jgi:hypothetical protein
MKSAEVISIVCALVAAAFGFWSASISVPQPRLSVIAGLFAAGSAIAGAIALYLLG